MPRQCRYNLPGIRQHVITRGVDRQSVFFHEQDYTLHVKALQNAAARNECSIDAYVLMTNIGNLSVTQGRERLLPLIIQAMGRNNLQRPNLSYGLSGTLQEGRFLAGPVQNSDYLLTRQ
jgi:putative transposase